MFVAAADSCAHAADAACGVRKSRKTSDVGEDEPARGDGREVSGCWRGGDRRETPVCVKATDTRDEGRRPRLRAAGAVAHVNTGDSVFGGGFVLGGGLGVRVFGFAFEGGPLHAESGDR